MNTWEKWETNPVIVSFNEKFTPVWQIPFPAITICPERKFMQNKFNYTDVLLALNSTSRNLTEKESLYLNAALQVCEMDVLVEVYLNLSNTKPNASDIITALKEMRPEYYDLFECAWENKKQHCGHYFDEIITEEGLCYNFNSLDPNYMYKEEVKDKKVIIEWSLENGYHSESGENTFPRRGLGAGTKAGLFLMLFGLMNHYDKLCRGPIDGFKISFHSPDETADISNQFIQVPYGQQILIAVKPKIITTSERLRFYKPKARQCYFQDERYLRFFKFYTQTNCEIECLANYTLHKCKCVKFSMPRSQNTPICGPTDIECYYEDANSLLRQQLLKGYKGEVLHDLDCDCLPACTSITYETEITQAHYNFVSHYGAFLKDMPTTDNNTPAVEMTKLYIFFKEAQFLTSKRSELYGTTDFLANCGGLLGLFMGFSLLSFMELIYFCTL
ncbi:pickpocket protein 28-like, partial [Condylostylus longicornis]|uniref:pickpocket protein 28-like n=1 Tax=Condylostylus longicornis TaxID=2530218 RepID=UPI00244E4CD1